MNVASLSERQRQILSLKVDYYTAKEIANRLNISVHAVDISFGRMLKKFGAHSRGELLRRARLAGIVPAEKRAG